MARPSSYTDVIADEICERLANGESLRRICLTPNFPRQATVFRWLAANEGFRERYACAREAQADVLADEIIDIADGKVGEYEEGAKPDVMRDKLAVDARKWVAAKLRPTKYGDKLDLTSGGDKLGREVNEVEAVTRLASLASRILDRAEHGPHE
jgi:hypothetical protein